VADYARYARMPARPFEITPAVVHGLWLGRSHRRHLLRNWLVSDPHPEERRLRRVSKDEGPSVASWFETAQERLLTMRDCHFRPAISFAFCPNMFFRASSSNGSFTNFPIASPACTCGRARTAAYQRLMFG
jgi:hypothetical protein